jgi:hypothetical protein
MNWRIIELYVEISSIDNVGDSLNNLPEISNRTDNTTSSTINLAYQIHDERELNDFYEGDDVRNEHNDVLVEEERNDDGKGDADFVPISTDGWVIGEDYWDSTDEDDDPNYDPHEYIERRLIMKNRSKSIIQYVTLVIFLKSMK